MQGQPSFDTIYKIGEAIVILVGITYGYLRMKDKDEKNDALTLARDAQFKSIEDKLDTHINDTKRHIDPDRDERRWQQVQNTLQQTSDSVNRLATQMANQSAQLDMLIHQSGGHAARRGTGQ